MEIKGSVKNTWNEDPIAGVKIVLSVGEDEIGELFSDKDGMFGLSESNELIGKNLNFRAEKEGFISYQDSKLIEDETPLLEIMMVPRAKELLIRFVDELGNPLDGVNVTCGTRLKGGNGISDKKGIAIIKLAFDCIGKNLEYRAERKGFKLATGEIQLNTYENIFEVILKKSQSKIPDHLKYWKYALFLLLPVNLWVEMSLAEGTLVIMWVALLVTVLLATIWPIKPSFGMFIALIFQLIPTVSFVRLHSVPEYFFLILILLAHMLIVGLLCRKRGRALA